MWVNYFSIDMKILSTLFTCLSISMVLASGTLKSQSFQNGKSLMNNQVANVFGCNGKNMSPDISWTGFPKDTKSFAITVYDPDAPTGSGFWHWVAHDIKPNVSSIKQGMSTKNVPFAEAINDYGMKGYGGACPPEGHGKHRYQLTVYALGVDSLPVPKDASPAVIRFMIMANTIEKSSIEATYSR